MSQSNERIQTKDIHMLMNVVGLREDIQNARNHLFKIEQLGIRELQPSIIDLDRHTRNALDEIKYLEKAYESYREERDDSTASS